MVYFSCGHQDQFRPYSGWSFYHKSSTDDNRPAIGFSCYCLNCYVRFITSFPNDIFFSWGEAEAWMDEQKSKRKQQHD